MLKIVLLAAMDSLLFCCHPSSNNWLKDSQADSTEHSGKSENSEIEIEITILKLSFADRQLHKMKVPYAQACWSAKYVSDHKSHSFCFAGGVSKCAKIIHFS